MVVKDNSEVVMLYGHIHSNAPKGYVDGSYHVGMDTNDLNFGDTGGFDMLFGCSFTAHYTNQYAEKNKVATEYLTQYSHKEPVVALPEEDALYTNGNIIKVVGTRPWYVFNGGTKKQFEPNNEYTKDEFISITQI